MEDASATPVPSDELYTLRDRVGKFEVLSRKLKHMLENAQKDAKQSATKARELEEILRSCDSSLGKVFLQSSNNGATSVVGQLVVDKHIFVVLQCGADVHVLKRDTIFSALPALTEHVRASKEFVDPSEAGRLTIIAQEAGDALRAYRVRAESMLRQRDSELSAARDRLQQLQSERLLSYPSGTVAVGDSDRDGQRSETTSAGGSGSTAGGGGATGAGLLEARQKIAELRAQVDQIQQARSKLLERDRNSRETITELTQKVATLSADLALSQGQTIVGAQQDLPARTGVVGVSHLFAAAAAGSVLSQATSGHIIAPPAAHPAEVERDSIVAEYSAYRKRAVGLLRERDESVRKMADEVSAARSKLKAALESASSTGQVGMRTPVKGLGSGPESHFTVPSAFGSHTPVSGPGLLTPGGTPDVARFEYLRVALVRFLTASDSSIRGQLEATMVTLLRLTPAETTAYARARAAQSLSLDGGLAAGVSRVGGGVLTAVYGLTGLLGGSAGATGLEGSTNS